MFFFAVMALGSSITSVFGPALRAVKDADFPKIVAETLLVEVGSTPFESLTNALRPYFEGKVIDHRINYDLLAFIKIGNVPEQLIPLLFQSYSYLAGYSKDKNNKPMLEKLFQYFTSRNHQVYAKLLGTAKHLIERNPSDLGFLFRIVDQYEKTYIDNRPGSDEFSLFLLHRLRNVSLKDVDPENAQILVLQVHMLNTVIASEDLKMRKWFFSDSVMATYPEVKNHMLELGKKLADKEPLEAYAILCNFGEKMTKQEQEPFMKLLLTLENFDLRGAAVAKHFGWVEEYKKLLDIQLAENNRLPPALQATLVALDNRRAEGLRRATLDLWRLSMDQGIYEGEEQNLEELTNEYYATLKQFSVEFSEVIRMHIDMLADAKGTKVASAIRMYLKNNWPLDAFSPLFDIVMTRLDTATVQSLYNLMNEFPDIIELKEKYLIAVRTLSQMTPKVRYWNYTLKEHLKVRKLETLSIAQVLLHVMILAGNGSLEVKDLARKDWDAISEKYNALGLNHEKPKLKNRVAEVGGTN